MVHIQTAAERVVPASPVQGQGRPAVVSVSGTRPGPTPMGQVHVPAVRVVPDVAAHNDQPQPYHALVHGNGGRIKLQDPDKWDDPLDLTSRPVQARDWIDAFIRFCHFQTGSYRGIAEALPFYIRNPRAQAWFHQHIRSMPRTELEMDSVDAIRSLFLSRYAPDIRDQSIVGYQNLVDGKVR